MESTILTFIFSCLVASVGMFAQTQEFTDEASFLAALNGAEFDFEDYEGATSCNETDFVDLANFDVSASNNLFYCNFDFFTSDGIGNLFFGGTPSAANSMTITFDSPKNAFATDIAQPGNLGPITITLMTDGGESYTAFMSSGGESLDNIAFYGLVTDMLFTSVIITRDNVNDGFGLDRTYCAVVPSALIPTMSQWALMILGLILTSLAVVRIRKVAVA